MKLWKPSRRSFLTGVAASIAAPYVAKAQFNSYGIGSSGFSNAVASGGGLPPWLPAGAFAFADFQASHYYANGAVGVASDLVVQNTDWNSFNPATEITPAGLIGNPVLELMLATTLIAAGGTYVLAVTLPGTSGIEFVDLPAFNWESSSYLSSAVASSLVFNTTGMSAAVTVSAATHKFAITMLADGSMAASADGASVVTLGADSPAFNNIAFGVNGGAAVTQFTVYSPAKANGDLPGLST